ncbi:aminoethylphosphonate catabolism LysR family transcriptional regulator [Paraburkholderia bannensis]|uniref:Aminoethylphosphonate catabolism LysR family transcriptional regulator n=1 Tax=Paraburkholderia bannensis TaxID=765414 RepID=A0A7W9WQ67_9BURK|nr:MULTISPECIES: LysR substrate-binding domain-containing protein [Paraburkholderia]MBB3256792.1 aminoethylphosphonate catabolism LysR family transcriptional regulator [Paraburkholderia sp. WP4_3_2]MBB6101790.1 aminoethylphosphonate catabolism LysR family transcriptional regulator [Paraburkholderia bannensis]
MLAPQLAPLVAAFYETVRHGSITAAARHLSISQPTVTARIQQLEKHYGVELFHRRGSRVELTQTGASLMPLIDRMMESELAIDCALRDGRTLDAGSFRLGTTGPYYILPAVAAFRRRYPNVQIGIEVGNSQEVLDALVQYRVDVAVSSNRVDDPSLTRHRIATDSLVLVVDPAHPLAHRRSTDLNVLAQQTLLLREPGSRTRDATEAALKRRGVTPAALIEIGSREAICEAIRHGLGCSLMPSGEVPRGAALVSVPIEPDGPVMHEYLYHLKSRANARLIEAFMSVLDAQPVDTAAAYADAS